MTDKPRDQTIDDLIQVRQPTQRMTLPVDEDTRRRMRAVIDGRDQKHSFLRRLIRLLTLHYYRW